MPRTTKPQPKQDRSIKAKILAKLKSKPKSRRTRMPDLSDNVQPRYHNFGGMLINPPESCEKRFTAPDGGVWTDLGICQTACREHCARYKWFCKAKREERRAEWARCGVDHF